MGHLLQPCRLPGGPVEGVASARRDGPCCRAFSVGMSSIGAGTRFASPHYRDWRECLSESARESEDLCPVRSRVCIHYRPAAAGQPMKRPVVSSCITSSFQTLFPQGDRAGQQVERAGQAGSGWQGRTPGLAVVASGHHVVIRATQALRCAGVVCTMRALHTIAATLRP